MFSEAFKPSEPINDQIHCLLSEKEITYIVTVGGAFYLLPKEKQQEYTQLHQLLSSPHPPSLLKIPSEPLKKVL